MKIIDNNNTLLGDNLKASISTGSKLKIASSCFSIYAYEALKKELSKIESLEFIFTVPTFVPNEVTGEVRKERREFFIPKSENKSGLYGTEFEIQLRNKLNQRAIARECADWIRSKATFRSNKTKSAMQQFACIQSKSENIAYTQIQGFTAVDLGYQKGDSVSNLVHRVDEADFTKTYLELFDQIWQDPLKLEDVTSIICDHIDSVYQENSPERIYFLMLYNIFSEFLENLDEDVLPNDRTGYQNTLIWKKLFNFQKDAATGIINKLETYNGCILADSVGLGKTFTALAVIKYYELRNRSVLVLCPKKISDNWSNYKGNLKTNIFFKDRFSYDVLCHTDLTRTSGESLGLSLSRINWGNYDLVVIDESHNFRNNDAFKDKETRYQKLMNKIIKEGVKTKVLMLSATPVNNRFNDLRNQLAFAYEGDSENLRKKLPTKRTIEEIFRRAQASFNQWTKLPPENRTSKAILATLDFDFFEMLDRVTIARSRKHIQTYYDTKDIGQFPERLKPLSFHSPLTARTDVLDFNGIFKQLSALKLAVYAPISYILPSRLKKYEELYDTQIEGGGKLKQSDREKSLQSLMTTNLLKRLESSIEAFRLTLRSLLKNLVTTIDTIEQFKKGKTTESVTGLLTDFNEVEADEDELPLMEDIKITGKVSISLNDMDVDRWKYELNMDRKLIEDLLHSMDKITPEHDAKLQHLKTIIQNKIKSPINSGNKKVLIFTAFADTANYLFDNLAESILKSNGLHTGKVTGSGAIQSTLKKDFDFQGLLLLFSPRSQEKATVLPDEPSELDILIGTDCISEGQNLQDCDYLINYDIHWNPVRILQRFGRIDRIGSINKCIQLVNYWPDISLDEYIKLKERVENRMMIADMTATGDDNILTTQSSEISYRKEQLQRLQEEVVDLEDLKTGISITDLGLNDFRMDLLNYIKTNGDLSMVPKGMHAVIPANPEKGLLPGVIFTLRNRNDSVNVNLQNRLHPYYLIYMGKDGEVKVDQTEVKKILDLVRSGCKGQSEPISNVCRLFNKSTDEGRNMKVYSDLLGASIRSMIDVKEEKDIDSLFTGGKTSALVNTIAGLDDFELIAFFVIQKEA